MGARREAAIEREQEMCIRDRDTLVGEGARALSGGQAQRIALARAFLDNSRRILLFDEPTAHLLSLIHISRALRSRRA